MPGLGGIEATRRILHSSPHISILVLSMFDDDDSIFAALQAGARGYLLKGAVKAEILRAIRAVASGEAIFGPDDRQAADRLLRHSPTQRPDRRLPRTHRTRDTRSSHWSPNTRPTRRSPDAPTEPQDHPQPRLQRLHQTPGSRSGRSNPPRSAGRTRWQLARSRLGRRAAPAGATGPDSRTPARSRQPRTSRGAVKTGTGRLMPQQPSRHTASTCHPGR